MVSGEGEGWVVSGVWGCVVWVGVGPSWRRKTLMILARNFSRAAAALAAASAWVSVRVRVSGER